MSDLNDYIERVKAAVNIGWLRSELVERMRVNVGLLAENVELKRRVQQFEEGGQGDAKEHLRRTKAALNTALYWHDVQAADPLNHTLDDPNEQRRRAQELGGCRMALDMAREALQ